MSKDKVAKKKVELSADEERMRIQIDKIFKRFGTIEKFFEYMNEQARGKR